jgi:hypothetical protein
MQTSIKSIIACGCLAAVISATAACSPRVIPPMTVTEFMEDRVMLDGALMKCNQNQSKARSDSECINARIAIERLDNKNEPAQEAKRVEEFEHSREQLRLAQEKQRREEQAKKPKVDAYHLPLMPVETPPPVPQAPSHEIAPANMNPPVVSQSNP